MKYALLYDDDAAARRHSATLLKSLGYGHVKSIRGDLKAWTATGLPTEGSAK